MPGLPHVMKSLGMGRRTRQYNPRAEGAQDSCLGMAAVMSMTGESDQMGVDEVVEMIHATPVENRDHFATEIWSLRRQQGIRNRKAETLATCFKPPAQTFGCLAHSPSSASAFRVATSISSSVRPAALSCCSMARIPST